MRIFLFYESDSFLHRLNPLTKLGVAICIMLILTVIVDPITPLVVAVVAILALWILGRVPVPDLLRSLGPFAVVAFGVFWTTAVFFLPDPASHPRTIATIGPVIVSDEGIAYGFTIMFRILGVFAASLLFVMTTDPTDLVQALVQKLRLNYRFGYGALAAYRFVPLFDTELATIRAAHRIRGVSESGGPVAQYQRFVGYMVPLLAGGVRKAERVALAMDARGFGAYADRTYYRRSAFGRGDGAFTLGTILVLGLILITFHQLGWLGQLIPPFLAR